MPRTRSAEGSELVQAVSRALGILETLAQENNSMALKELAERAGLKVTTAHRLLSTLMAHGFAAQDRDTLRYRLGFKAFEIGNAALASMDIRTVARPFLRELVERVNETTNLAILDQGEVVYIDQLESTNIVIVKMFARIGSRGPAHCTGSGKVLLAGLPDGELQNLLDRMDLVRFTGRTLTQKEDLLAEIEKIRDNGYAVDRGERDEGVYCVAAPIRNHEGRVVAAISVSAPTIRLETDNSLDGIIPAVVATAGAISSRLGFTAVPAAAAWAKSQSASR